MTGGYGVSACGHGGLSCGNGQRSWRSNSDCIPSTKFDGIWGGEREGYNVWNHGSVPYFEREYVYYLASFSEFERRTSVYRINPDFDFNLNHQLFEFFAGTANAATGEATTCVACPPGSHDNDSDPASACEMCPLDTYQDAAGSETCISCPDGKITHQTGSTSLSDCTAAPDYVGCFEDRESLTDGRDLTGARFSMDSDASVTTCEGLCAGWSHMALQSTAVQSDLCFCDNKFGRYGQLRNEWCGTEGDACGQGDADSCQLRNAVFRLMD